MLYWLCVKKKLSMKLGTHIPEITLIFLETNYCDHHKIVDVEIGIWIKIIIKKDI